MSEQQVPDELETIAKEHFLEHRKRFPERNYASYKHGFREGFETGMKQRDEQVKEEISGYVVEKVPCDCHLFKNRVCDFCQGLTQYIRARI